MKLRQDAWSEEDDLLLAETVLRHVREGSTQLNAFEEVGDQLNRTSAACGFRWNAVVRQTYEQSLQLSKKQRKDRQRALSKFQPVRKKLLYSPPTPELGLEEFSFEQGEEEAQPMSLDNVWNYLQMLQQNAFGKEGMQQENKRLKRENASLLAENNELMRKIQILQENSSTIQEDYEVLMKIMNRARRMVALDDEKQSTAFKMDRNGNLEKIAE